MAILSEYSVDHSDDTLMSAEIYFTSHKKIENNDMWMEYKLNLYRGGRDFIVTSGNIMLSEIEYFYKMIIQKESSDIFLEPMEPDFSLQINADEYETVLTIFTARGRERSGIYDSSAIGMRFAIQEDDLTQFFATLLGEARTLYESAAKDG